MTLFNFIIADSPKDAAKVALYVLLAGIANTVVLAAIGAELQTPGPLRVGLLIAILLGTVCFAGFLRIGVRLLTALFEQTLYRTRLRLSEKVRRANPEQLERIGAAHIYEQIVQSTTSISYASWPVAAALLGAFMFFSTSIYVAALSGGALLLLLSTAGIAVSYAVQRNRRTKSMLQRAANQQLSLFNGLTDLLHGFQEVRGIKQVAVVKRRVAMRNLQQPAQGMGMDAPRVVAIEPLDRELTRAPLCLTQEPGLRHIDPGCLRHQAVRMLQLSAVRIVIASTELYQPRGEVRVDMPRPEMYVGGLAPARRRRRLVRCDRTSFSSRMMSLSMTKNTCCSTTILPFFSSTRPGQPFFLGSADGAPGLSGQASTASAIPS